MIGIGCPPYQKKSLKTQNRASVPEGVAITGFYGFNHTSRSQNIPRDAKNGREYNTAAIRSSGNKKMNIKRINKTGIK